MDEIKSLRRKLAKRERRIAGMERRIHQLERALAMHVMRIDRLPKTVATAVQEALCNVRLIPVSGVGRTDKIVSVRTETARKGEGE